MTTEKEVDEFFDKITHSHDFQDGNGRVSAYKIKGEWVRLEHVPLLNLLKSEKKIKYHIDNGYLKINKKQNAPVKATYTLETPTRLLIECETQEEMFVFDEWRTGMKGNNDFLSSYTQRNTIIGTKRILAIIKLEFKR